MFRRTFCFGDIHGHFQEFQELLTLLIKDAKYNPKKDNLVLLGDLVDSGPDTKKVLDWAVDYKNKYPKTFHPLYGNHESLLLDALSKTHPIYGDYYLWWNQGGKETIDSYCPKNLTRYERALVHPEDVIPKEHLDFIHNLPYYYQDDKYFYVHAGVYPNKLLKDHDFKDKTTKYFMIWARDEFLNSNFKWEKKIIFGHSSKTEYIGMGISDFVPNVQENKIGISTMPRRNIGHLTALELPAERFYMT